MCFELQKNTFFLILKDSEEYIFSYLQLIPESLIKAKKEINITIFHKIFQSLVTNTF